jgi:predicted DNA-binding protein (MmcQ/YjbR family)
MNIEEFREYCLVKKGVSECFPFDETTLVFKVADKMFALTGLDKPFAITIKAEPETGAHLRELFPSVLPAYHMNKTHWLMVNIDGSVDDKYIKEWIDESYNLVVSSLNKKQKEIFNTGKK